MDDEQQPIEPQSIEPRRMDLEGLKALAHPLRVQIIDTLATYGSFTASGLAERLGESSGATSYHLRQLEKNGFVREVEGKGTVRERWWERVPGGILIEPDQFTRTPAGRAASRMILREWNANRTMALNDFLDRGDAVLPAEWHEASAVSTSTQMLTVEQTKQLTSELMTVIDAFVTKHRGQRVPGARPVQTHINVFPVLDADEIPEEDTP
jgi:DNA-binding transcriptional ArsR family regulator